MIGTRGAKNPEGLGGNLVASMLDEDLLYLGEVDKETQLPHGYGYLRYGEKDLPQRAYYEGIAMQAHWQHPLTKSISSQHCRNSLTSPLRHSPPLGSPAQAVSTSIAIKRWERTVPPYLALALVTGSMRHCYGSHAAASRRATLSPTLPRSHISTSDCATESSHAALALP